MYQEKWKIVVQLLVKRRTIIMVEMLSHRILRWTFRQ